MDSKETLLVGKSNLVSSKEEALAKYLKETNLERVNAMVEEVHPKDTVYTRYIKRLLDLLIAVPAFLLTLPFNFIFGICTFFDVGRPIFYKQARTGKKGKLFILVKFRNMNEKKDENGILLPAKDRVTKFGKFMRKFSLDELLNFWSVIKGDMSIIGPRPQPMFFYDRMNERHKMRTAVRPGLECPRVIKLKEKDLSQYHIQFENDIWYVENVSFLTDVKMLFGLIKMVFSLKKRDRQAKGNAASYFVGYDEDGHAMSMNIAMKRYENEIEMLVGGE